MTPLGYVVLARRPNSIKPVSAVFPPTLKGLEQAQNARLGAERRDVGCDGKCAAFECICPVEYMVGEIGRLADL